LRHFSSLNYKDALSASGNRGVTRQYPHVPGIDAAGVVVESSSPRFKTGDQVIASGFDIGMNISGGFGQYIRIPAGLLPAQQAVSALLPSPYYHTWATM
jgi:NADPH:quinone reductase-like Zn-dependent oxidoreductase